MFGPHLNHLSTCSSYCRRINLPCLRYWGTVTAAPSRDLKGQRFAYHNWDFTAAAEVFTHYDKHYQASQKDMAKGCKGKMLGASSRWIDRAKNQRAQIFTSRLVCPKDFAIHWTRFPHPPFEPGPLFGCSLAGGLVQLHFARRDLGLEKGARFRAWTSDRRSAGRERTLGSTELCHLFVNHGLHQIALDGFRVTFSI